MTGKKAKHGHEEKKTRLRAIDLFSGCGGLTVGLKRSGFRVIGAVEIDSLAAETYKANHKRVFVWQKDIRRLSAKTVMKQFGLRAGDLALLAGCPPCQGFSILRTRNGAKRNRDWRNSLLRDMLRFSRVLRPKAIMMENVPGLVGRSVFLRLCAGLRKLDYKIVSYVKDAALYGVPQRRKRLILLAGKGFEIPFGSESRRKKTVRETIGRLKKPGKSGDPLHDVRENRSKRILRLIRDIPKNGGSRLDLPRKRQLACHRRTDGFKDIYGRMAWNEPAPTITGGCFNPSKGRFLHPSQNRAITMREAALLQGFSRRYRFPASASKTSLALMIGNALPPELIRRHGLKIQQALLYHGNGKSTHGTRRS